MFGCVWGPQGSRMRASVLDARALSGFLSRGRSTEGLAAALSGRVWRREALPRVPTPSSNDADPLREACTAGAVCKAVDCRRRSQGGSVDCGRFILKSAKLPPRPARQVLGRSWLCLRSNPLRIRAECADGTAALREVGVRPRDTARPGCFQWHAGYFFYFEV